MKYDMRGSLWRIYLATGTAAVIGIVRTRTAGRDRLSGGGSPRWPAATGDRHP